MDWFGKKKKEENMETDSSALPELPKLPELPEIDESDDFSNNGMGKLPNYRSNSLGERFSRNAIKSAVTGKEDGEEDFDADDSLDEEEMMQKPRKAIPMEFLKKNPKEMPSQKSLEPVFVRIDKFEEGHQMFDKAKEKLSEIEKLLAEMKSVNEKEERELERWENEILSIKKNFEKMDKNIFSKI